MQCLFRDNKLFCTVLSDSGYNAFPAAGGEEALEIMEREYIDLIVADIMLPNMDGYELEVAITDHGEGMTEDLQKHIFEKFYQADTSRKAEGNGLGLALVKRIVDLCNREISVESETGKGSEFKVLLPYDN